MKDTGIPFEPSAREKYDRMIDKIPLFHRTIADKVARKRAEMNARERGAQQIEDGDIIRAFFMEVPKAFYSLMIKLMEDVGFHYERYEQEYEKRSP